MDRFQRFNSGRAVFFLLATITVIIGAAVLKITSSVLLPFTIALLLAIVTSPLVKFMEKFHIPRIIAVLLVLTFLLGGLGFMGMVLFSSGRALIPLYPKYEAKLTDIYIFAARFFELPYDEHLSFFDNIWGQIGVRNRVRYMTLTFSNSFLGFLKDAVMVAIFMAFISFEAAMFREKLGRAFEGTSAEKIKRVISDIMTQVTRYLSVKFVISVVNGILIGIGLWFVGLEFAAVWGVIQFIVNFIPTIGSIAVGLAATAFAMIQFWPDIGPTIAVGLIMLIVNVVIGNVFDPKIMGDRLGLSPLVILVSLLIWSYLWGFAGLILAVPMTAIIKIACENFPMLEPISILLGSRKAVKAAKINEDREGMESGSLPG